MTEQSLNIALLSPNEFTYSETFIKAHKERLRGSIHYYYGGNIPGQLEGHGYLMKYSVLLLNTLKERIGLTHALTKSTFLHNLKQSFIEKKIDLVFMEYGVCGASTFPICEVLNLPFIVHFHGFDASDNQILAQFERQYQAMFQQATYIVVVSKAMQIKLETLGCPKEKLILNPYGPHERFFKVQPHYTQPTFTAVGRFTPKKAPLITLQAFHQVWQKYPEVRLVMVGDTSVNNPLFISCKKMVDELGMKSVVTFSGVLAPSEIATLFKNTLAFVQHSVIASGGDQEGTPVAILEAGAAGLPVIATRHAGIPDVVLSGETGILVEEQDIQAMADAMINLLINPILASTMGQAAKKRIQAEFSMEQHISTLNALIDSAVNAKMI